MLHSSFLSADHSDVENKFLADAGRYITLSNMILLLTPSLSVMINFTIPIYSANAIPETPTAPILDTSSDDFTKNEISERI